MHVEAASYGGAHVVATIRHAVRRQVAVVSHLCPGRPQRLVFGEQGRYQQDGYYQLANEAYETRVYHEEDGTYDDRRDHDQGVFVEGADKQQNPEENVEDLDHKVKPARQGYALELVDGSKEHAAAR